MTRLNLRCHRYWRYHRCFKKWRNSFYFRHVESMGIKAADTELMLCSINQTGDTTAVNFDVEFDKEKNQWCYIETSQ
ncbi:hypothetical protein L5M16_20870 [Shewanella sp. SM103]|uniref:hypothetical protein n=1 Tax=Shewanella sp. SM103 TaxID=2912791 RepID=UPI0021D83598|nr:hypothetical protein [Shewanella sp. SM103]MCU8080973.1 hypothetical protein [Shewanella sp. SM103]